MTTRRLAAIVAAETWLELSSMIQKDEEGALRDTSDPSLQQRRMWMLVAKPRLYTSRSLPEPFGIFATPITDHQAIKHDIGHRRQAGSFQRMAGGLIAAELGLLKTVEPMKPRHMEGRETIGLARGARKRSPTLR